MKNTIIRSLPLSLVTVSMLGCSGGGGGSGVAGLPSTGNDGGIYAGCTDPTSSNYNPIAIVDDGSCVPGSTGNKVYKAYFYPPTNTVPLSCDGTITAPYTMTYCMDETNSPDYQSVDLAFCSGQLYPDAITYKSPAGNKVEFISNGRKYTNCAEGASVAEATGISYVCNSGYYQSGAACVATPPPADTTIPKIYLSSSQPESPNFRTSMTFTFSTDEESIFYCQIDGTAPINCGSGTVGSKTIDQLGLINVSKTIKIWAVDLSGNSGQNDSSKYYTATWQVWGYKTLGLYDFEGANGNDNTFLQNDILGTFFNTMPAGFNGGISLPLHAPISGNYAYLPTSEQIAYNSIDMSKGITVEAFIKESNKIVGVDMPIISKAASSFGNTSFEVGIKYTSASAFKIYYMASCANNQAPQRIESAEFAADISVNFGHVAVAQVNNNVYLYFNADKKGAGTITAGGCTSTNKYLPYLTGNSNMYVGVNAGQLSSSVNGIDIIDRLRISRTDRTLATDIAANLCRGASICTVD